LKLAYQSPAANDTEGGTSKAGLPLLSVTAPEDVATAVNGMYPTPAVLPGAEVAPFCGLPSSTALRLEGEATVRFAGRITLPVCACKASVTGSKSAVEFATTDVVWEAAPWGMTTVIGAGTTLGLELEKFTVTPPAGAGLVKVSWRFTVSPGATVERAAVNEIRGSAGT